ncbi:MAG TPA: VWA domain-containing protein [Vicinamibacterales bacterium]|nr:VWA domain-containing protein [Vicinamibacterales bacterium]
MGQVGRVGLALLLSLVVSGFSRTLIAQQPPPKPSFQSSVEVTSLDVTVVDDKGKPITTLAPADFAVRIDGNPRHVVSAEWVPLGGEAGVAPPPPPPEGYTTNEGATAGRLIVIAVDQPNIRFGGAMAIARAANGFIDRLLPSDRVAVAGIGLGAPATVFTADRARVKQAIARMAGQKTPELRSTHGIALVEALAIDHGETGALETVVGRECAGMNARDVQACAFEVEAEARDKARNSGQSAQDTINALAALFTSLRSIDAPKTLIFISEGFILNDPGRIGELGSLAASARTSLFALRLDAQLFDITGARAPVNSFADHQAQTQGLEMLAGVTRGALFTVIGSGENIFDRITSELSGYYMLGVESDGRDKDGKPHPVRIEVGRRGAIVRSRRQLINAASDRPAARSPRAAAAMALSSPLLSSALPVRIASFALQGPERNKVQLLIHADVGTDYPTSKVVSVGYVITDGEGKVVDNKSAEMRLLPVMNGVPSPLQYTTGASLAPGEYTMKLAVAEGDRVGSIEHVVRAALPAAGGLTFSELMVGGSLEGGQPLTPTIGDQINFGAVHGYMEVYGAKLEGMTMEYEVATAADAPALLNGDVPPHAVGDSRVIFSKVMPVQSLPPGRYILRAILSSASGASITTLRRGFEVAAPKVLLTSAEGLGSVSVDAELFLPIDEAAMNPAFRQDVAVEETTLAPFRERVAPTVKAAFDQGIVFLAAGDWTKAELSFKKAIDPDADSTSPLTFLAASFAAAGKDREAASAWQTALVDGTDFPQIYAWLAEALLRTHDFGAARAILEEASGKWPADTRFTKPLAMLYATFGRGREAVRTLERYLDDRQDDRDAYFYAVQWIYTVHAGGAVVHTRAEDRKRAHDYADAYLRARGPQSALVKQWMDYLDTEK